MSIVDSLKSALGQIETAGIPGSISAALAKTNLGNLQGLVNQLQQGGLKSQVQSWLGTGANLPINADQLRAALGNDHVKQLAAQFGIPIDAVLKFLAEHLPTTVDQASPNGTLPPKT